MTADRVLLLQVGRAFQKPIDRGSHAGTELLVALELFSLGAFRLDLGQLVTGR